MQESDSIVIIPTYNEKENIEKIIRAVFGLDKCFHILVIDDGSPDGTASIVRGLMQTAFEGRLFIIERAGKLGLGTAYIAGFKWALEQGYDYVFEMDADFSHDPNDLPRLYAATHDEGYDMAIGSRYVSGVNVVNWPMGRVLMSYFASKYVRLVTGFSVHDTTAGFVCYRRRVLETIPLDEVRFKGYGFQIEMKYTAYKIGFKIKEVPVVFVNRREGVSKMSGSIFGEAFFGVMQLRLGGWVGEGGYYLRQKVRLGDSTYELPRSLRVEDHPYLKRVLEDHEIFVNRDLMKNVPDLAAPIVHDGRVIAVIQIYHLDFEQWSLYEQNLLSITARLVAGSLANAYAWEKETADRKYLDDTRILRAEEFDKVVAEFRERRRLQPDYPVTLLPIHIHHMSYRELDHKIANSIRAEDVIGATEKGVSLLLSDVTGKTLAMVRERLAKVGIETGESQSL